MYFGEAAINESKEMNIKHIIEHPEDIFVGLKIHPHQDLVQSFKKHSYPGLLDYVNTRTKLHDVEYIVKDTKLSGGNTVKTIIDRMEKVEKGQCTEKRNVQLGQ